MHNAYSVDNAQCTMHGFSSEVIDLFFYVLIVLHYYTISNNFVSVVVFRFVSQKSLFSTSQFGGLGGIYNYIDIKLHFLAHNRLIFICNSVIV